MYIGLHRPTSFGRSLLATSAHALGPISPARTYQPDPSASSLSLCSDRLDFNTPDGCSWCMILDKSATLTPATADASLHLIFGNNGTSLIFCISGPLVPSIFDSRNPNNGALEPKLLFHQDTPGLARRRTVPKKGPEQDRP